MDRRTEGQADGWTCTRTDGSKASNTIAEYEQKDEANSRRSSRHNRMACM